jgi:ribosome biogenesis protein Nip4
LQANLARRNSGLFHLQTQEAGGKAIRDFAFQCGAKLSLNPEFILNKSGRYFLVDMNLRGYVQRDFYYAGTYLGKAKKGKFFPSFNLLAMLAKGEANKVVVDKKAAWLFICGRDIFRRGILAVRGSRKKGDHTLVLNEFGECLGFGKIVRSLDRVAKAEVAVKNISDVGDFLRREV